MQPPLVREGRFLERESGSHEPHRVWRYVTTLFRWAFPPSFRKKKILIFFPPKEIPSLTPRTKQTSPRPRSLSCPASLSPNQVRARKAIRNGPNLLMWGQNFPNQLSGLTVD